MRPIEIIDAPSILELFPLGVERLADALREQGLAGLLGERAHRCVDPLPNTAGVDPGTGIANATGIIDYAAQRPLESARPSRPTLSPWCSAVTASFLVGVSVAVVQDSRWPSP